MRFLVSIFLVTPYLILAGSIDPALSSTIHVPSDEPSIQAGIETAVDGDVVLVAPGTYVENVDLLGKAITLRSDEDGDPLTHDTASGATVMDGARSGAVLSFRTGETCDTLVEGFTIRNGSGVLIDSVTYGGGIVCDAASPTIRLCLISQNSAGYGGGILCADASPEITGCTIFHNLADHAGGIGCILDSSPTITSCTILFNVADDGGGIACSTSSPTITGCTIERNSANEHGSGICLHLSDATVELSIISDNSSTYGGGICCTDSSPLIEGCTIERNSANLGGGGISCYYGSPTIRSCTISENSSDMGGGIGCYLSDAVITSCTISKNSAARSGGGIFCSSSSPTISSCLISENSASYSGGGIYCYEASSTAITDSTLAGNTACDYGGGIFFSGGFLTIADSTLLENRATDSYGDGGGIYCLVDSSMAVTGSTLSGNIAADDGGGIHFSGGSLAITNCILWSDFATSGPEIFVYSGSAVVGYSDVQGGWLGQGNLDADPLFRGGGDYHLTIGSPCIDTGTDAGVYSDLDGDARPQGAGFDMGADEYPECWDADLDGYGDSACGGYDCDDADPDVNPGAREICAGGVDEDCDGFVDSDDPNCAIIHVPSDQPTIQVAIDVSSDGNLILVAPGTYIENIDFLGKAVRVESQWGPDVTAIDGNEEDPVVTFSSGEGEESVIAGFMIRNGKSGIDCLNYSSPFIVDCRIVHNRSGDGGGIYCYESAPTIANCTISDNTAAGTYADGGGIYCGYSSPSISSCTISDNVAGSYGSGGGLYCFRSTPSITNCTIARNRAEYGGGITFYYDSPTITNCTISDNSSDDMGGGIYCNSSSPRFTGCTITANSAESDGGGIRFRGFTPTFTSCTISANSAGGQGGGVFASSSTPAFTRCTILDNSAWNDGGGIYSEESSPTLEGCTISGNASNDYGGGICCRNSFPTMTNCLVLKNMARIYGGGMYCGDSSPTLVHCTLSKNRAGSGGGIYSRESSPSITSCILWKDTAYPGPEIHVWEGSPMVAYSDVQGGWPGPGNIDADPLFLGGRDYHLTGLSPCIDAGTDGGVHSDMDGDGRPQGAGFDMGADEYPECWDADMDGFGDSACGGYDCDDTDPGVNPSILEICTGGVDEDCDGLIDSDDPECGTLHVPAEQPTIQSAIDVAADGNLIVVAPGTYPENIDFLGKAIRVVSEAGADSTVIDGGRAGSVVTFADLEPEEALLDGFTLRNGGGGRDRWRDGPKGAGIHCYGSWPTITDCRIIENHTEDDGGGIFCEYASPLIVRCTIARNSAMGYAGTGGGIYCHYASPTIANCTISRNRTEDQGGGIHSSYSSPTITSCTIAENSCSSDGGGIYCTYSYVLITNCIVWGNQSQLGPQLWVGTGTSWPSTLTVSHSDLQGGAAAVFVDTGSSFLWGDGNIDEAPLFLGDGDFHITIESPCIDTGADTGLLSDIDGDLRPLGAGFDMGSDEYPECWDADMDGYGSMACGGYDCDDTAPHMNPGRLEVCTGGLDEDCDGLVDSADPECDAIHVPAEEPTIQSAIDRAVDGNRILVAPGTYQENIDFLGKAIRVQSEAGADATVIDGGGSGSVVTCNKGETADSVLQGFRISNGTGSVSGYIDQCGGGIFCYGSSPTIRDCAITGNAATWGGGIYGEHSFIRVKTCSIFDNGASQYGGGAYFTYSNPSMADCTISQNRAYYDGGGIYSRDSDPSITRCTISQNSTYGDGGGICSNNGTPTITDCTLWRNRAEQGGGFYCNSDSPVMTNCTLSRNMAESGGGIYFFYSGGDPVISHCTIAGNSAFSGGSILCSHSSPRITNCILWSERAAAGPEIYVHESLPTVTYSDVQGGWPGEGNIDSDPRFLGVEDHHLTVGSPCIDAGIDLGVERDIDGDERPTGAGFDMGSDEYPECLDGDLDGYARTSCGGYDCDDASPDISPGASEICSGGVDEDCDGFIDSDDPVCVVIRVPTDRPTIQSAIDIALDGNLVLVAPGTYTENIDLLGKAIIVRSEAGAVSTVIDGNREGSVVTASRGETDEAAIEGFSIRNGRGTHIPDQEVLCGGGIFCYGSSPTIKGCILSGNSATWGGGIYYRNSFSSVHGCTVTGNRAYDGGGIHHSGSDTTITNCAITRNVADGSGAGIYSSYSSQTIMHCTVRDNSAYESGGGVFSFQGSSRIENSIAWGNSAPQGMELWIGAEDGSSALTVSYSDVRGSEAAVHVGFGCTLHWGPGNIDQDPLFTGEEDFHLTPGSPCIDAGTDGGVLADIDEDPRPQGAGFDMGADEYTECRDGDMDGHSDTACGGSDCDDADPEVNPGARELCGSGIDEDCDGLADSDDPDCVTLHVPADHPTIQDAMDTAVDGNLILVAPGTYLENIRFYGKSIRVESEGGADVTVIDGGQAGSAVAFLHGESKEAVLEGFTITNGIGTRYPSWDEPRGGGIYCYRSSPSIVSCKVSNNSGYEGRGIYSIFSHPTITNCTISANSAYRGGGFYCHDSLSTITHCTFAENRAHENSGGVGCCESSMIIENSIFWGDVAPEGPEIWIGALDSAPSTLTVSHSDVQGGGARVHVDSGCTLGWLDGNIDADPLFGTDGAFHLTAGSPCVDAGIDAGVYGDIDGDGRPLGAGFDMGADEYPDCWDADMDGYGHGDCGGYDCDDSDPGVNPGAREICEGGIDEDCDGLVDLDDPQCVTIHVPGDKPKIQYAINAGVDGNVVLLAPGTYSENIDFRGKAIHVRSEAGADATIIQNTIHGGSVVTFASGETEGAVLEGFRIRWGDGTYDPDERTYYGGGIFCLGSSPRIKNCTIDENNARMGGGIALLYSFPSIEGCTIIDNTAIDLGLDYDLDCHGGGIYCHYSAPTITGCTVTANIAVESGGGIDCYHSSPAVTGCVITRNMAMEGGGVSCFYSSPTISRCAISGNFSLEGGGIHCFKSSPTVSRCAIWKNITIQIGGIRQRGGGIYCYLSSPTIANCTIFENSAIGSWGEGGGIACVNSSPTITNSMILWNLAREGGGIYCSLAPAKITNSVISRNVALDGGGILCLSESSALFTNCIISGNVGNGFYIDRSNPIITHCTIRKNIDHEGAGIYSYRSFPAIANCIVWGNASPSGSEIFADPDSIAVLYSDVLGGWPGPGNIDADPLFAGAADSHLTAESPCIDAAMDAGVLIDIDRDSRPHGTGFDMGADEFWPAW